MNEDKLLEKIKKSAESCEIPEGITPEHVDEMVKKQSGSKKRWQGWRYVYGAGAGAAAVLVLGIGFFMMQTPGNEKFLVSESKADTSIMEESDSDIGMAEDIAENAKGVESFNDVFHTAKEYDEVLEHMKESEERMLMEDDMMIESSESKASESIEDSAAGAPKGAESAAQAPAQEGNDYSTTNLQVEDVDESDIVKTDGEYLYVVQGEWKVRIVKAEGGTLTDAGEIVLESGNTDESIVELYLEDKELTVITQGYGTDLEQDGEDSYLMNYKTFTGVYTYDVSDPGKITLKGKITQDGSYNTSRKVGGYLYLFTNFYPPQDISILRENQIEPFVPAVDDIALKPSDIYLPKIAESPNYLVISSVDTSQPDHVTDQKSILLDPSQFYVTTENIYVYSQNWSRLEDSTSIAKFHFKDGKITGTGAATVPGSITDTFALNEQNGYLRVLTTEISQVFDVQSNGITILNEKMNTVGELRGLAKGETIYSARFMGDTGYFVTYRNTDPLFTVDLSSPENPKIIGELKITGFSEYLHFYGENQLLGIGWETDPETGTRKGLKLSMFDISNPAKVTEIKKAVIKNVDTFPGESDYKALTISPDKNIIGFVTTHYATDPNQYHESYLYNIFSYNTKKGFQNQMTNVVDSINTRGVYINNTFYTVDSNKIVAYDIKNAYQKVGEI